MTTQSEELEKVLTARGVARLTSMTSVLTRWPDAFLAARKNNHIAYHRLDYAYLMLSLGMAVAKVPLGGTPAATDRSTIGMASA